MILAEEPVFGAGSRSAIRFALRFDNNYAGVSYNRLMVTILQAMGLQAADYEGNGLNAQVYGRNDIGTQNTNLSDIGGYGLAVGSFLNNSPGAVINLRRYDFATV